MCHRYSVIGSTRLRRTIEILREMKVKTTGKHKQREKERESEAVRAQIFIHISVDRF